MFEDSGLSEARISLLFIIWSVTGFLAVVPSGALADRWSRRGALVASGLLQAAGYVLWIALPGFAAFAAGFVLWGLGGAFATGALEALLYEGLASVGAQGQYARVQGRVTAAALVSQLPAAAGATLLFSLGGYVLAGWVSIGVCLGAAALAARLPEARSCACPEARPAGCPKNLRNGIAEAAAVPAVRAGVLAVAALGGLEGLEEYSGLLARDWGVPSAAIPIAILAIPMAGAAGAALAGAAGRLRPAGLSVILGAAAAGLAAAALLRQPAGLAAVAAFYALYQLVAVVANTRLQERIEGPARATVTSVGGLGTELSSLALYAFWSFGGAMVVAGMTAMIAAALPWWLRRAAPPEPKPGQSPAAPIPSAARSGGAAPGPGG